VGSKALEQERVSYTHAVKPILLLAAMLGAAPVALAQPAENAEKINVGLEVRSEGRPSRDEVAARLLGDVRRGLEAIGDVAVVPWDQSRRIIWIVAGTTAGSYAASVIFTERYDRETLMVLGIEDDDMAERMMALQIVNDHQIFTGRDPAALSRRIVTSLNEGVLAKLRSLAPKP
jgi:hypothetical protein